jgi:hypothetical protein
MRQSPPGREFPRQYWQPVCTSDGLDDLPKKVKLLCEELDSIIDGDRLPLSPRIQIWKTIRMKLGPEPPREPKSPPKHYEPSRVARRQRGGR